MKATNRVSSLETGMKVKVGYAGEGTQNLFLGFTDNEEAYSEKPVYKTLKDLKKAKGVKNYEGLEALQSEKPYGHHFYAVFRDLEEHYTWCAYLWEGAWRVGTSADRLQIFPPPSEKGTQ